MSFRSVAPSLVTVALLQIGCAPDRTTAPLATPDSASPIVFGSPDVTNTYSNVGAVIAKAPNGQLFPFCTGTLIAPNVVLTAAHCTAFFVNDLAPEGWTLYVSFRNVIAYGTKTDAPTTTSLIAVTSYVINPTYSQRQGDVGDLSLLTLASAPAGITPATLPTAGLLDELAAQNGLKGATFIVAGYGVQDRVGGGGRPSFAEADPITRGYAFASFMSLNKGYLRLSQNPATGDQGACYGDSGGPNFLSVNGQLVLVAITITGDIACRATNVVYRLDNPTAQEFLAAYLP